MPTNRDLARKRAEREVTVIRPAKMYRSPNYAPAVSARGSRTLYVSGQWSYDPKGELVGKGDLRAQAVQAFKNLKGVLAGGGATPADVVKINVYVVNYQPKLWPDIDAGISACFGKQRDFASTVVGVQALARARLLIEVEATAVPE